MNTNAILIGAILLTSVLCNLLLWLRQRDLKKLACRDRLTGALNRLGGEQALQKLRRARRPCSVLMVDVDNLKGINDVHYHSGGDVVLKATVAMLRNLVGSVVRLGGDEFLVILPRTDVRQAVEVAELVRRLLDTVILVDQVPIKISVSLAVAPVHGFRIDSVLEVLSKALHVAKEAGRNRVAVASFLPKELPYTVSPSLACLPAS